MLVRSLTSLSGLTIRHCHEWWCRSQTLFGSHVAMTVAEAGSYSSDLTPSLGTSICHSAALKKKNNNNNNNNKVIQVDLTRR